MWVSHIIYVFYILCVLFEFASYWSCHAHADVPVAEDSIMSIFRLQHKTNYIHHHSDSPFSKSDFTSVDFTKHTF